MNDNPNESQAIIKFKKELEALFEREEFKDISLVIMLGDETQDGVSFMGNACLVCASEALVDFIDEHNIPHMNVHNEDMVKN